MEHEECAGAPFAWLQLEVRLPEPKEKPLGNQQNEMGVTPWKDSQSSLPLAIPKDALSFHIVGVLLGTPLVVVSQGSQ